MSEEFNGRPIVLTKQQTEEKHAAQAAQQAGQNTTILQDDNKAIQVDVAQNDLAKGDVIEEAPTVLDAFISTEKSVYTVQDANFKNDITGQTGVVVTESVVKETPEAGMEMFFKP